jgi:hypothetical protein
MTARAARNVVDNVINTTGIVQANAVSLRNGEVVLDAGDGGTVQVAGTVEASGQMAGETGGGLQIQGAKIAIADGTKLEASGAAGGGTVNIGSMDAATGAQSVMVGKATIIADATVTGKGGSVTILSKGTTRVAATISAKGVIAGGTVETSGQDLRVDDGAQVDTSAPNGATGLWLLDPVNVNIDSTLAANIVSSIASTNVSVTASNDITVNAAVTYSSGNSLALLAGHNLTVNANVQNGDTGSVFAVAGWDGVTSAANVLATPAAYGNNGGSILIGGAGASGRAALGSGFGATIVAAHDLTIAATRSSAQLGYHGPTSGILDTNGSITVLLNGQLIVTGGNGAPTSFAEIGNGGHEVDGDQMGDITINVAGPVTISGGSALNSYARIGNGGLQSTGIKSGKVILASGGDITLNAASSINAGGPEDALVLAAQGNFINHAGAAALNVTGGGRWLVFLDAPGNNSPGGLSASPYYNRTFDFTANSYAPVTSAGNRFVYALAPMVTVTIDDKTKVYGGANPPLTATVAGGLPGDSPAGAFTGSPVLQTAATTQSGVGNYVITGSLGTLASDFNYGFQFVSGTLHIDPAVLTASLTGVVRKTYDGTTVASPTGANVLLSGVLAGDDVTVSGATGAYDNKNVGTGKLVNVGGLNLAGADKNNYVLASSNLSAAIGTIDPALLTASLTGTVRKTYDGTVAASLSGSNYLLSGVIAGDSVALNPAASGSYDNKNAGTGKLVSVSGLSLAGADKNNYVLASSNASAAVGVIDPALLTASLTGVVRKTFDGTASATLSGSNYLLSGAIAADSVALNTPVSGLYDSGNAGTGKTVSIGGVALTGADKSNYSLLSASLSGTVGVIDPAVLVVLLTGTVQKAFDGTTAATLSSSNYALSGVIPGFGAALNNPVSGVYDNANAGTGKTVSVSGLALSGSGNYVLSSSGVSGAVGIITAVQPNTPPPSDDALIASIQNPVPVTPPLAPPPPPPAPEVSDATSAIDTATLRLPNFIPTSASVIDGLLRRLVRPPGSTTNGVPPFGQIHSSWGNEAFWQ